MSVPSKKEKTSFTTAATTSIVPGRVREDLGRVQRPPARVRACIAREMLDARGDCTRAIAICRRKLKT